MVLGKELLDTGTHSLFLGVPTGLALNTHKGLNLLPKRLRREELFMILNHVGRKVLLVLFVLLFSLSGMTKLNLMGTRIHLDIEQRIESQLIPIKQRYDTLIEELTGMQGSGGMVEFDKNFYEKEVAILKLLSNVSPKEIFLTYLSFRKGWPVSERKRVGRAQVTETNVEDPDQHFIRLEGMVTTNPALQEAFLGSYVATLTSNGLFQNISIEEKSQESKQGLKGLSFVLKCQI